MNSESTAKGFVPAWRILALVMGIALLVFGAAGLVWHIAGLPGWVFGENIGVDIYHLAMGVLAIGAAGSQRSAKGFGGFAFIVFLVTAALAAAAPILEKHPDAATGAPTWLAENEVGFSEINYILYLLMALWGLLLTRIKNNVDAWGSGERHGTLQSLPDREDVITSAQRQVAEH